MTVRQLNHDQLIELKQNYLMHDKNGDKDLSWSELIDIDSIVSDEEVLEYYGGVEFVVDDFLCSAGEQYERR